MKTARNRRRNSLRENKKEKTWIKKLKYIVIVLIFITFFALIIFMRTGWDKKEKLTYVVGGSDSVEVVVLDPSTEEIVYISIPGNTNVKVARSLGEWKIKSVWDLSFNEAKEGSILAQTVTRNFYFPVYYWSRNDINKITKGNPVSRMLNVFKTFPTNLTLADKFNIFLYSLKIRDFNIKSINLEETYTLESASLLDGSQGYTISRSANERLHALFFDPLFAKDSAVLQIIKHNTNPAVISNIGEVVGVLGGKVTSVKNSPEVSEGCFVYGKNSSNVQKLANIFNCTILNKNSDNYDVVMEVGSEFERLY